MKTSEFELVARAPDAQNCQFVNRNRRHMIHGWLVGPDWKLKCLTNSWVSHLNCISVREKSHERSSWQMNSLQKKRDRQVRSWWGPSSVAHLTFQMNGVDRSWWRKYIMLRWCCCYLNLTDSRSWIRKPGMTVIWQQRVHLPSLPFSKLSRPVSIVYIKIEQRS